MYPNLLFRMVKELLYSPTNFNVTSLFSGTCRLMVHHCYIIVTSLFSGTCRLINLYGNHSLHVKSPDSFSCKIEGCGLLGRLRDNYTAFPDS